MILHQIKKFLHNPRHLHQKKKKKVSAQKKQLPGQETAHRMRKKSSPIQQIRD
jgi:hypothetical protein